MSSQRNYRSSLRCLGVVCLLLLAGWLSWGVPAEAHEIPADVVVHVFVKPEGHVLRVLVRAPLEAMRDVTFPMRDSVFLDLAGAQSTVRMAAELWIANGVRVYEDGRALGRPTIAALQVSLPTDVSFERWDQALAHVQAAPLPADTQLVWTQARLDVLLEFEIQADTAAFAIETDYARLGLRTLSVIRFLPPGGSLRVFQYSGDAGVLHLDPRWYQAAGRFVTSGVWHILGGIDHLLFLVCLVVPLRRMRSLVFMVTAFTVAHSFTLAAAAFGFVPDGLWFPPLVETLIALSIVWMALENIVGTTHMRRRWAMTLVFGLVHGFGFSFALRDTLQFGGTHFVTSLVSFNLGVEVGQVLALLVIVPVLHLLFRYVTPERIGSILVSALVAHHAWHWMLERGQILLAHGWPFTWRDSVSFGLRTALVLWVVGWLWWQLGKWRK